MAEKHDEWVRNALGADPAAYELPGSGDSAPGATSSQSVKPEARQSAVPPPIDPASLPPGPLSPTDYAIVGARNKYLAGLYDPKSLIDRAVNVVTGSMDDPANILTDAERAEHLALGNKIIETLNPPPTRDEARLDALENSPLGAVAFVAVGALGGSQAKQDLALGVGAAVEGVALSVAGARTGTTTKFLGAQTGDALALNPSLSNADPDASKVPVANLAYEDHGNVSSQPDTPTTEVTKPSDMAVSEDKQGKHQPEHRNFIKGRSELTYPDPQALVRSLAGTGQQIGDKMPGEPGSRERVECKVEIGNFIPDPRFPEQKVPTTCCIIHYATDGVHIVPAKPQETKDGE